MEMDGVVGPTAVISCIGLNKSHADTSRGAEMKLPQALIPSLSLSLTSPSPTPCFCTGMLSWAFTRGKGSSRTCYPGAPCSSEGS